METKQEQRKRYYEKNKEKVKQYYQDNKEKISERQKKYRKNNKEKVNERARNYYKNPEVAKKKTLSDQKWRRENWVKYLLSTAKKRAQKVGLEFNITEADVFLPTHCHYLGVELTFKVGGTKRTPTNASLDRIDSSKGYVKGNVQILCVRANTMKNDSTREELLTFAKNVLNILTPPQ